jgi:16S rRNA (guanine966-N2)-methyltransferase
MRIIAGAYKGIRIAMPKGIRPTRDKVREAVFNVLGQRVNNARILDLFAGSGAMGIESLSRSAEEAVFVDNSRYCTDIIYDNITRLSSHRRLGSVRVLTKDAYAAIRLLSKEKKQFDILFIDPPYLKGAGTGRMVINDAREPVFRNKNIIRKCLMYISIYDILCHLGLVVIEHFKKDIVPEGTEKLLLSRQLKYGDTVISIYKKKQIDNYD